MDLFNRIMDPFNREKKIVALGHPSSGKSCYMQMAISYLFRYGKGIKITKWNTEVDKVADQTEEILSAGKWPDKTELTNTYQIELSTWAGLKCKRTLIDWPGEAFTAVGLEREGCRDKADDMWKNCAPCTKEGFVKDCEEANGFLLFLDGERLLQGDEEWNSTRECLYWLKDLIMASKEERIFSIIVTKSEFLEGTPEFGTEDSKKVHEKKIYEHIREKCSAFFKALEEMVEENRCSYLVAPVTCLPVPEHREDTEKGTFANNGWKLEDMQKSNIADSQADMIEPIRWLINNL